MRSCESFFLQMQPNLITHLVCVWHSMLVMTLLVLGIGFFQNVMDLLANVLDPFHKFGGFINLSLRERRCFLCGGNGQSYIDRGQWLKPHACLKRAMTGRAVKGSVVAMLNIRQVLVPCAGVFRIIHPQDMHNHAIHYFCLPSV